MKTENKSLCRHAAYLACLLPLLWTACEREVDFSGQLPEPRIVINCFAEAGHPVSVRVTRSRNPAGAGEDHFLYNAEVLLYINDVQQPPMQPVRPDGNPSAAAYVSESVVHEGDRIRIVCRKDGFAEASAEDVVPGRAQVLSVDTVRFGNAGDMLFRIKIKDVAVGQKDFYRLIVEWHGTTDHVRWTHKAVEYACGTDAALSDAVRPVAGETPEMEIRNIYGLFTDELFDGSEYTLTVSFAPKYPGPSDMIWDPEAETFIPGDTVRQVRYVLKLVTLSPDAYLYLKSRTFYEESGEPNIFREPPVLYTNIRNGLGILGTFQTDSLSLEMSGFTED